MTDRPIIFSAPMIRALLDGRKVQDRRVLKPQPSGIKAARAILAALAWNIVPESNRCNVDWSPPTYAVGDRLWVREAWRARLYNQNVPPRDIDPWATRLHFEADGSPPECDDGTNWNRLRTSTQMPRWASRLTLTVTDLRVQRLQEISEADALAEGADYVANNLGFSPVSGQFHGVRTFKAGFTNIWNSLHGPAAWDANPWVVALTFTAEQRNIDAGAPE